MADDSSDGLDETATRLLTESGYLNAMAELYTMLTSGEPSKNQTTAYIGARRCLESFADARIRGVSDTQHDELKEELRLTREAMKQQGSGGTNFSKEQVSLPRRPSKGAAKK